MKIWKKNLIAAAVLVTVCAGIYVNWLYTENQTSEDSPFVTSQLLKFLESAFTLNEADIPHRHEKGASV